LIHIADEFRNCANYGKLGPIVMWGLAAVWEGKNTIGKITWSWGDDGFASEKRIKSGVVSMGEKIGIHF
jgi:hypothetical protein